MLVEKLLNVLKLARSVQVSNQHLRNDIVQMSQIIDDMNIEISQQQQEIEQLYQARESQTNFNSENSSNQLNDTNDQFLKHIGKSLIFLKICGYR